MNSTVGACANYVAWMQCLVHTCSGYIDLCENVLKVWSVTNLYLRPQGSAYCCAPLRCTGSPWGSPWPWCRSGSLLWCSPLEPVAFLSLHSPAHVRSTTSDGPRCWTWASHCPENTMQVMNPTGKFSLNKKSCSQLKWHKTWEMLECSHIYIQYTVSVCSCIYAVVRCINLVVSKQLIWPETLC